uniref:Uncharacterized protein n=1 Tax=Timema douglasi TaxID=61478 RepID=A0A7R8ZDF6_TIMDO|nr:unnamed protein product [Timema douglasi]
MVIMYRLFSCGDKSITSEQKWSYLSIQRTVMCIMVLAKNSELFQIALYRWDRDRPVLERTPTKVKVLLRSGRYHPPDHSTQSNPLSLLINETATRVLPHVLHILARRRCSWGKIQLRWSPKYADVCVAQSVKHLCVQDSQFRVVVLCQYRTYYAPNPDLLTGSHPGKQSLRLLGSILRWPWLYPSSSFGAYVVLGSVLMSQDFGGMSPRAAPAQVRLKVGAKMYSVHAKKSWITRSPLFLFCIRNGEGVHAVFFDEESCVYPFFGCGDASPLKKALQLVGSRRIRRLRACLWSYLLPQGSCNLPRTSRQVTGTRGYARSSRHRKSSVDHATTDAAGDIETTCVVYPPSRCSTCSLSSGTRNSIKTTVSRCCCLLDEEQVEMFDQRCSRGLH